MEEMFHTSTIASGPRVTEGPDHPAPVHVAVSEYNTIAGEASHNTSMLRDLWLSHIFWVRNVCLAYFNKNDIAMKVAEKEVMANAQSLAAVIARFYGGVPQENLFKLLADHYGAIRAYLIANAAGDASGMEAATELFASNAEEIAMFLSKTHPNLPRAAITDLLLEQGNHHIQQIQELKEHEFEAEAKTWEHMKVHIYTIADAIGNTLAQVAEKS